MLTSGETFSKIQYEWEFCSELMKVQSVKNEACRCFFFFLLLFCFFDFTDRGKSRTQSQENVGSLVPLNAWKNTFLQLQR